MKSLNEYYDHHPNDSRVTGPHTIANSVCARYGTGGATLLWCFAQNQRDEVRLLGEKAGAVMANPGMKQQTYVVVLNDQGGAVMNVTENKTNTLRAQDHGHPPLIIIRKEHEPTERNDIRRLGDNESNQQEYAGVGATLPHSSQRQSEHCGDTI